MSRHSLFTVYFLLLLSARGAQVNVTVDDIDPSIVYTPAMSWNSSQVVCSSCDNPSVLVASQQTYHKGIHLMLPDGDDSPTSPAQSTQPSTETSEPPPAPPPPPSAAAPPAPPLNTPTPPPPPPATGAGKPASPTASSAPTGGVTGAEPDDKGGGKNANGGKNGGSTGEKSSGKKPGSRRRGVRLPRLDFDDVGFVDTPVFAQFNFTGTAVYVFCIQPLGVATSPQQPSLMNLTFSLDNVPTSSFIHQGSSSASEFAAGVNVFFKQGLMDGPHTLRANLAPNSVFILDYVLVTRNVANNSATSSIPVQSQLSSPSEDRTTKSGRASFAGAVAGSLGVLGILCFGTAFSIYRRRQRAARRERLERGNAPPPAPMSGPVSFIPRYFPGTVVPSTPPPYAPSDASSSISQTSGAAAQSEPLLAIHPEQTYADIPPPLDELAPPSFGVAIATPAVTLLSSSDVATPPPRPQTWDSTPHTVALPPSIAPTPRTTSLFSADNEHV